MANTIDLRRRIKSAQNISKTTRAMQMIAASKLKKAQHAVLTSRPYVEKLITVAQNLSPKEKTTEQHPYLGKIEKTNKTLYIVIASDKGLCGGLITNLIREYIKIRKIEENSVFITIGKKVEAQVATSKKLLASFPFGTVLPSFAMVEPLVRIINEQYLKGDIDQVKILATHFTNVFTQMPQITDLLPVVLTETKEEQATMHDFLFEPSKIELLPTLLKRYIEMVIYQQLLEAYASFNAAQMLAMQNATNNAKDIVNELQLLYNKARQEKITKEILDISSAAIALAEE